MVTVISLSSLQSILNELERDDVLICIEPDRVMADKNAEDKLKELWVFDPSTGICARGDGKFFQIELVDRGGWNQLAIREEPNAPQDQPLGQVIVQMNVAGQVRVRRASGLNGEILELMPSSLSKGDVTELGLFLGTFESNPQRIIGRIQAVLVMTEFPDEEAMWIDDFLVESTDARSITALAKTGLLTSRSHPRHEELKYPH